MSRIALLAESADPARGGAERAIRATAQALVALGAEVELHVPRDRAGPELPGVTVRAFETGPLPRATRARKLAYALAERARERPGTLIACGKLLGADLIWSHAGVHARARDAQSRAGRSALHGSLAAAVRGLRPVEWTFAGIEREQARACHEGGARYVALSERVAQDAREALGLEPSAVVPNGVDAARFAPPTAAARRAAQAALAARVGAPPDAPLALFAATAPRLKGFDAALGVLASLPELQLVVAGSRPRVGGELGARVHGLGFVDDLPALYHGARFLLHPSRYDPCSLVVLEALASGLAVVTTRADGASAFVTPERGVVAASAEDPELAAGCARLCDPAEAARAQEAAAGFRRGWDDVARELLALVQPA
ncbi:MAG: glycosyltransferase family 4 protein [Planctomycetota bacterium]